MYCECVLKQQGLSFNPFIHCVKQLMTVSHHDWNLMRQLKTLVQIVPRIVTHFRLEIFSVLDSQYFLHALSFTSHCPHLNLMCLCQWKSEMNSWGFSQSYNPCFCSSSPHLLSAAGGRISHKSSAKHIVTIKWN